MKLSELTRAELLELLNDPETEEQERLHIALRLSRQELDRERIRETADAAGIKWQSPW